MHRLACSRQTKISYGVVEVDAVAASMMTVRVLVLVLPEVSVVT